MRISTKQMQNNGVNAMLDRQVELSKTQQQLATGKRILTPSDDVNATIQALALNKVIASHEQYQTNANMAETRLQTEETAVTQVIDALQRIHELAIQSNSTTITVAGRQNLAPEVRVLIDGVFNVANTMDSNDEYIFAGNNVNTIPFTATENPPGSGLYDYAYTGDLGQRNIQIGASRQIVVSDPGQDVFMDIPLAGGGTQNLFETLEQFALDLESGSPSPNMVADVLTAMDHLSVFRSKAGARQNAIDNQRSFNDDVVLQSKITLSEVQDLDFAEAVSRMNLQLVSLEASQQSFSRIQNLSLFNFL